MYIYLGCIQVFHTLVAFVGHGCCLERKGMNAGVCAKPVVPGIVGRTIENRVWIAISIKVPAHHRDVTSLPKGEAMDAGIAAEAHIARCVGVEVFNRSKFYHDVNPFLMIGCWSGQSSFATYYLAEELLVVITIIAILAGLLQSDLR
jgi:hypothetical protein